MNIAPAPIHRTEMLVVVNDTQLKRQCDEEALGACIAFLEEYVDEITHFVFNGDILDMEEQSSFSKFPDQHGQSKEEIEAGKWLFRYISALLPNAEKVFIYGNHDARWDNLIKNQTMGLEAWIRPFEEMFEFKELDFQVIPYGTGNYYRWHDRIFWHGHRAGAKSNIPKLELEEAGISVTTAHINRNMFFEYVDAMGTYKSGITHGGFSKNNLSFMKKASTGWSQGFGVYYWNDEIGEQPYSIIMKHKNPTFIFEGKKFTGKGFRLP